MAENKEKNTQDALPFITADEVRRQIGPDRARELIEAPLKDGFDVASDPDRGNVAAGSGHLLLMPSTLGRWVGMKVASVAPDNPEKGKPRIQALYILMDSETLTPQAVVEGSALTVLRTPATSAVAIDRLAAKDASRLVVFGSGPQAIDHIDAIAQIRELKDIRMVARNAEKIEAAIETLREKGREVTRGAPEDVEQADIVMCATSAPDPLFDGSLIADGACVAAIGSHEPDRRELPGDLVGRSFVVVEDEETAMREAGDVVLAVQEGKLDRDNLNTLSDLVNSKISRAEDRPNVFKGTGMSWQDLAVASGLSF